MGQFTSLVKQALMEMTADQLHKELGVHGGEWKRSDLGSKSTNFSKENGTEVTHHQNGDVIVSHPKFHTRVFHLGSADHPHQLEKLKGHLNDVNGAIDYDVRESNIAETYDTNLKKRDMKLRADATKAKKPVIKPLPTVKCAGCDEDFTQNHPAITHCKNCAK